MKTLIHYVLTRLFEERPFHYNWEQRDFERNREQTLKSAQNTCRWRRD